jgi:hypothetical protein
MNKTLLIGLALMGMFLTIGAANAVNLTETVTTKPVGCE